MNVRDRFRGSVGLSLLFLLITGCGVDERSSTSLLEPIPTADAAGRSARIAAVQKGAPDAYRVAWTRSGLEATNAARGLRTTLTSRGVEIAPAQGNATWRWHAAATRWGCAGELSALPSAEPEAQRNRVDYDRGELHEWYVNGPLGLEQGFTVPEPPPCQRAGSAHRDVVIELRGSDDLVALVSEHGHEAWLRDASGEEVLRYTDLYVVDATGRQLPAAMAHEEGRLAIRVDDTGATYPLEIDPLIWAQQTPILAKGRFGWSVGLSANTIVGGAYDMNAEQGTAYVLGPIPGEKEQLTAKTGAAGDHLGWSVALSGDTILVGAPGTTFKKGAAHVFVHDGSTWVLQQTLTASDGVPGDALGTSVALSGDTAIVGAASRMQGQGAAYVFVRTGSAWTEQQTLTAGDGTTGDGLGISAALSGETVLLGAASSASKQGAAYAFVRSGAVWSEQQKLTAKDGVAGDELGTSIALSGDTAVAGAASRAAKQGAAYVFVRAGATWTEQQMLGAKDGAPSDAFGSAVAVNGETALVGAASRAAGEGAAYVFGRAGSTWTEQQTLTAKPDPLFSEFAVDSFGYSLAMISGQAIVGAPGEKTTAGQVFTFSLKASDGDACGGASECASGFCSDGVCCNSACDTGACDACSKTAGAPSDGTCALLTGGACGSGTTGSGAGGATMSTGNGGGASSSGGGPSNTDGPSGCGCRIPSNDGAPGDAGVATLALAAILALRRRRKVTVE